MFSFFKRKKKNNTEKINKNVSVEEINQNEEVVLHPNERLSPEDLENISETQDKEEIAQKNKKDLESDEKVVLYPNERLSPEDLENISETQDKEEIAQENKKDLESDEKVVLYPNERLSPEDLENISETQDKEEIAQENKKDLESDEKSIDTASKEEVFTIDDYINENKEFFNSEDNNSNNNTTKKSFFGNALKKTFLNIKNIIPTKMEKIPSDIIEEMLIESDMDYEVIEEILDELPKEITKEQLKEKLLELLNHKNKTINITEKPFVRLIIGVNGAGKTTTIAKLANNCIKEKETVLLGAGDTFRAAAIEQLSSWADKLNVPIIKTKQGHDSSAVAYDTISSAVAKKIDNVIIDTAGRLQTQTNLNNELKKIVKVCSKAMKNAPHQKLLILDGTQGNSAIAQAQAFNEMVGIDGIIITKLDGTAKGGAIFSISKILKLPILYIGIGETQNDLLSFNAEDFVDSILNEIYINNTKKEV